MEPILVAKSYQDQPKIGDVFISNNKKYINVELKSGKIKAVRVYTEKEYNKMYGATSGSASAGPAKRHLGAVDLKKARGFSVGPITLITTKDKEFLNKSNARYACDIGWYFVSTEEIPSLPSDAQTKLMTWEEFNGKSKM